jgi:hypothetical protein
MSPETSNRPVGHVASPSEQSVEGVVEERIKKVRRRRDRLQELAFGFTILGFLCLALAAILIVAAIAGWHSMVASGGSSVAIIFALSSFIASGSYRSDAWSLSEDLRGLEFELDLLRFSPSGDECRAEKLLAQNDYQLRRYHRLNLRQCSAIFVVGILCLLAGFAVIVATFVAIRNTHNDKTQQLIIGIVGALGAVLSNFVAAIYLKMHAAITTNLAGFHDKLVDTHRLYFANVLASRIGPDDQRYQTLQDLSLAIVERDPSGASKSQGEVSPG